MVRQISQFITDDGRVFDDQHDAECHEGVVKEASAIKRMLPNNEHLSGGDFYRIPKQMIINVRQKLANAISLTGQYPVDVVKSFRDNTDNIIGRYLDDSESPFYGVWWMLDVIDDEGRMFSQPFFKHNPDQAGEEVGY